MNELNVGDMIKIDWRFYHFFASFQKSKTYSGNEYFLVSKKTKKYIYFEAFSENGVFNDRCTKFKSELTVFKEMITLIPSFCETIAEEERERIIKSVFNKLVKDRKKGCYVEYIDRKINFLTEIMMHLDLYHNDVAKVLLTI